MALLLDFAVVIILILTAAAGWNKGFLRYIVSSVGTVAAIIIAFLLADILAPTVYEKWIQPDVRDFIEEKIDDFDISNVVAKEIKDCGYDVELSDKELDKALSSEGDISQKLAELAEKKGESAVIAEKLRADMEEFFETRFPDKFNKIFTGIDTQKLGDGVDYTKKQAYDVVRALADNDVDKGSSFIEYNLVRPFVTVGVKILLTILLFVVVSIVVRILFSIAGVLNHVPVANSFNRLLGMLAGIIKGGLYLIVIAFGLALLIESAGDSFNSFNLKIIDETFLFRHLFYLFYDI
ncbi:MAG: CvpA family protein [Ruminococcus sp.]|nr:CvpA family protein [Ruminococcus sp.]